MKGKKTQITKHFLLFDFGEKMEGNEEEKLTYKKKFKFSFLLFPFRFKF